MEAAPVPQQPPPPETEEAAIAALTLLLLSGQAVEAIVPQAVPLLGILGIGGAAAKLALGLIATPVEYPSSGLAQQHIRRTSYPRRAAYVVNAAKRLEAGGTVEKERTYLAQHANAERARVESASRVDEQAAKFGQILGWRSRRDGAVTRACAAADGHNFDARRAPTLPDVEDGVTITAYPGAAHGGACRCLPVPAWPNGKMLA